MIVVKANALSSFSLGRRGENLARQVVFDLSEWVSAYGDGTAELIYQRPGDEQPYPVAAVRDGSTLVWTVSNLDTAVAASYGSFGHCELRWYVGDVLVKSKTWRTLVEPAMDTPSETAPPAPEQGWVDQVVAAGSEAKAFADAARSDAERAEKAATNPPYPNAETGTWWVWDIISGAYQDSGEPYNGGVNFKTDETLTLKNGVLSVNTAQEPDPDNTLPITSAAVHTTVGNIEILLQTI